MKFWISVTISVVVVTAMATALIIVFPDLQTRANETPPTSESAPLDPSKLPLAVAEQTEETRRDLPQLFEDKSKFVIRNDGPAPLELSFLDKTCTCAEASFESEDTAASAPPAAASDAEKTPAAPAKSEKDEKSAMAEPPAVQHVVLPAGGKTIFVVKWNTKERVGVVNLGARVRSNDPRNGVLNFRVVLDVNQDVVVSHQEIQFGSFNQDQKPAKEVTLYSVVHDKVEVTKVITSSPTVKVTTAPMTADELKAVKAKSGVKATVTLDRPTPGSLDERISFTTNVDRAGDRKVAVTGTVEGNISTSPRTVNFNVITPASQRTQKVTIFAGGLKKGDKFVISAVEPSFLKVELTQDAKLPKIWYMNVTVPTDAPVGEFRGNLALSNSAGERMLNVGARGIIASGEAASTASVDTAKGGGKP